MIKIKSCHERSPFAKLTFKRWTEIRNEHLIYKDGDCWLPIRIPSIETDVPLQLVVGHLSVIWTVQSGITEYRCVPFQFSKGTLEACMATVRIINNDQHGDRVMTLWIKPDHREHWPYFVNQ